MFILIRRILIAFIVLAVLLFGAGWMAMNRLLTKEALISQMESSLNCKVTMDHFEASAFSFPASLRIKKLNLLPTEPTAVSTGISVEELVLQLSLLDLIQRRITIEKLHISGVYVRDEITKEGRSPLAEMFGKPSATELVTAGASDTAQPVTEVSHPELPAPLTTVPAASEPVEIKETKSVSVNIKEALLDRTLIHIVDRKARNKRDIHDLRLRVYDVDIDPANLAHHNKCSIEISGRTEVIGRKKVGEENVDAQFLNIPFSGKGSIRPFDPATGLLEPSADLEVVLAKDSLLGGHMTIGEAAGKDKSLKDMEKYLGLDLSALPIGGALQQELLAKFKVAGARVEWLNDTKLVFADYSIMMKQGSWSDSREDDSRMAIQFIPSDAITKKLFAGITERYGDGVADAVKKALELPAGGAGIDFILTGPLAKPSVSVAPETMQRVINAVAGNSADLLKGLLGR